MVPSSTSSDRHRSPMSKQSRKCCCQNQRPELIFQLTQRVFLQLIARNSSVCFLHKLRQILYLNSFLIYTKLYKLMHHLVCSHHGRVNIGRECLTYLLRAIRAVDSCKLDNKQTARLFAPLLTFY
jgi:hypothetical protein